MEVDTDVRELLNVVPRLSDAFHVDRKIGTGTRREHVYFIVILMHEIDAVIFNALVTDLQWLVVDTKKKFI